MHNKVSVFNPRTEQWREVAPLNNIMTNATATISNGQIYVFGVDDLGSCREYAERYDPRMNRWDIIPHPFEAQPEYRYFETLKETVKTSFAIKGNVYVTTESQVLKFDPNASSWERLYATSHTSVLGDEKGSVGLGSLSFLWHV